MTSLQSTAALHSQLQHCQHRHQQCCISRNRLGSSQGAPTKKRRLWERLSESRRASVG
jgi:hypothetical protein